jgi:hypothetical protein
MRQITRRLRSDRPLASVAVKKRQIGAKSAPHRLRFENQFQVAAPLRHGGGTSSPELSSFFGEQTGLAPVEGGDFLSDRLRRREISHEGDHFLMRFVDLDQRRAFRAGAFDGATAIDVRIERRMPWAFAAPSDAADLQHWFYVSRSLPRNATPPEPISSPATAQSAIDGTPLLFTGKSRIISRPQSMAVAAR